MSLTLVNLFTVPAEEAESFVARFRATVEKFSDLPGFGGTELHRNTGVGDQTYSFVNIATWESAEAWRAALAKILPGAGWTGAAIPKAALYESVLRFPNDGVA
jgi:heme-degrading monooxygenase HmoA